MSFLSPQSLQVIQNYLHLPFPNKDISCPYFNNRRVRMRGGLRALIGKGSPEDIVEEATIISLREKIDLNKLSDEDLKKFLVDNKLGVDCSGLVYHILDAEMKSKNHMSLHKILRRPWFKNPIRKLLIKLRPVENTGVGTFNHDVNSTDVKLADIQPGDMIIMMGAGPKQDYNHVLMVSSVIPNPPAGGKGSLSELPTVPGIPAPHSGFEITITYTHSFQYPTDRMYNHGVKQEEINILDPMKSLFEQEWSEPQMKEYAINTKECKIKRLRV